MTDQDCPSCQYDVPYEERMRIGPGCPLCRHPDYGEPGFFDRPVSQCYKERVL
jgi:hypothetical protein